MTESMIKLVHRAIRGDRSSLCKLIEHYKGMTYALAYRRTRSFPRAQRLAVAAWARAVEKLPWLREPERWLELLEAGVKAARIPEPVGGGPEEEAASEHSVLRAEKLQARRALRKALAECPLPESAAFFQRYVEGLAPQEIAELYGVEIPEAVAWLRKVCVDLAYRAGFAGTTREPPAPNLLSPERRAASGFAVEVDAGGVTQEERERMARIVSADLEARREDEAVKQVLALAPATFAAHRLPPEFSREALMAAPFIEPPPLPAPAYRRRVARASPRALETEEPPAAPARKAESAGFTVGFCLLGAVGGFVLTILYVLIILGLLHELRYSSSAPDTDLRVGSWLLLIGLGIVGLLWSRPPLRARETPASVVYLLAYGCALGAVPVAAWLMFWHPDDGSVTFLLLSLCGPIWLILLAALCAWRHSERLRSMEQRIAETLARVNESFLSPSSPPSSASPTPPSAGPASAAASSGGPDAAGETSEGQREP